MKILIFILVAFSFSYVQADEETRAAVQAVQEQMKSPQFHQEASKNSPEARQVEMQVKDLAGSSGNEQEIYNLAAEVLGNMKDKSPDEMKKMLQDSQGNPEAFANSWTPEQKRKLEELAKRLPASQQAKP